MNAITRTTSVALLAALSLAVTARARAADALPFKADRTATITAQLNNATTGAGMNQFEYVGKWRHQSTDNNCHEGDISFSNTAGDTMRLRFFGTRVRLYGTRAKHHGTGMVSVDDGEERETVFRAAGNEYKVMVYESPVLPAGPHTLKLRVTDGYSAPDYVEIDTPRGERAKVEILGGDLVLVPKAESLSLRYSSRVVNAHGYEIAGETATWSLQSPVKGVSLDAKTGVITVNSSTEAGGAFVLVATAGDVQASKKVDLSSLVVDDWLFQAEGKPLGQRAAQEIGWAREMAGRIKRLPGAPDLSAELGRLDELQKRLPSADDKSDPAATRAVYLAVRAVKRAIMLKHPAIDFTQLLFIDQPLPRSGHEAQHRNGPMASPGGQLLVQEGLNPDSPRRQLAPAAPGAAFWRPDLSFDARKVLFCMRPAGGRNFHLYEIGFDGTGLRQLTNGQYDDLDPIYLPDGHIMFSTGRAHTYIRCMPETTSYVLARCDADGRNIYVISRNNECDWTPALLNDGRVLYTRWEYTDKPIWRIQSLWTINQDGTGESAFWGNQSVWPDTLAMARPIPGSQRVMFVGVGHHNWFAGSVGIVDPAKGYNYPDGLTCVTTEVPWAEVGRGPKDVPETADYHSAGRFGAFQSPWPLSEDLFLVSASARKGQFDLYLMDIHGNRELIAKAEGNGSVLHAMPVKRRSFPRQPDSVSWPDPKNQAKALRPGILFSPDVYEGVPDLPRGIAKRLRIIQQDHKTYSTGFREGGAQGPAISGIQADSVKRVLGTVPVAEDGSVAFEVPPGRALFFQLLDDKGRAVQTMRSFTGAMPGEIRGCRGCHEARTDAPPATKSPRPLNISAITPPPWGTNVTVGYPRFVQPVIDKHCVSCHAKEGKARDALDLTQRTVPATGFFGKQSEVYHTLINNSSGWPRNMWIATKPGLNLAAAIPVEDEPRFGGGWGTTRGLYATLPPMTYLSYKSRLIDIAMSGKHHDVKITGTELDQLIAWVDCNAPFRGDEEVRAMPRMNTAPVIDRFNIPQDTIPERGEVRK